MSNTPTTITLPVTVRNIREAKHLCHSYKSVLTVGPEHIEVDDFFHPDHRVIPFRDTTSTAMGGPTIKKVEEALNWGKKRDNILVHCHAGISRSTATAWGISIAHGHDPEDALHALIDAHPITYEYDGTPTRRTFAPNGLIVKHLETIFGYPKKSLSDLIPYPEWF
jgi:predicted protein tyrosine phosphatase